MSEAGAIPRRRKILKYLLWATAVWLVFLAGIGWYITTDSFQALVRRRLISEIELVTGGRVELGSFHTSPFRLRVEVLNLTIHGREKRDELPYVQVPKVVAQVKVISALGFEFGFHSVVLEHPSIHILTYADGTTNQPTPKVRYLAEEKPLQRLFDLSIGELEVRDGELLWNEQRIPLDFQANDVSADMTYSVLHQRYFGNLLLGKIVTRVQDFRPVAWMAEAHFALGSGSLNIGSLTASSGRSHVQASCVVHNLSQPTVETDYDAKLDLAELSYVTHRPELRGGQAEVRGHAVFSAANYVSEGKILLSEFGWKDGSLVLSKASGRAQFAIDPQRLRLSDAEAQLLGGSVAGSAEINDWPDDLNGVKATEKDSSHQRGAASLRIKDLSLGAVAEAISTSAWPLREINLSGSGSGTMELRWRRSPRDGQVVTAIDISPRATAGGLPVTAHMRGVYQGESGELELSEFSASTPGTQIRASGKLAKSGNLTLDAETANLAEWQPVLAGLGHSGKIPVVLHGQAEFSGVASGRIPNVTFNSNLRAQDFDYELASGPQARTVHWDNFHASLQLSAHAVTVRNGTMQHGDTSVNFGFTAALQHWQLDKQAPFSARLNMHDAQIVDVLTTAGYQYPAHGTFNLSLRASGTFLHPQASGQIQLANAVVRGASVQSFESNLRLSGTAMQLDHMQLAYNEARVAGSLGYDFSSQEFQFDLQGTDFNLEELARGRTGKVEFGGRLDFTAQGSGTAGKPTIKAALQLKGVTLNHHQEGDFTLQAATKDSTLHLEGNSRFTAGALAVDGDVDLRRGWQSSLDLRFTNLDLDAPLRPYLQSRLTGPSTATGTLHLRGPLLQPRDLSFDGSLTEMSADVENMKLHNQGPVDFSLSGSALQIKNLHLLGEGTDFSAAGSMQLDGEYLLDAHASGQGNLKLLESFDPAFSSGGIVAMDVDITGSLHKPILQGRLKINDGSIAYLDLPSAFTEINGSINFSQDRWQIESLTAHTGGGLVTFGGNATWINHQLGFNVTLQEKDVRLRYPPGISSTADADLHWIGNFSASSLTGDITVTRLAVMPGFDFGAYLVRSSRSAALPVTNPTLNRIRLDVHIVTTPELQMQTAVVRLSGDADLRLRGSAAKPVILGRAEVLEGEASFNGTKYEMERGEVTFTNPVATTPVLDLQATTHVRDYDITLSLNGEPDKLRMTYRSEPPLPEADIITLLALGRTTTESAQLQEANQSSFTQEASSAIISQALNATVTNRAQRLFGVSRIKIDPEGLNTETTLGRGPSVTIEQQVANNLTITYSTSVEQASQQIIQLVYDLPRNISIVAIRDQDGVVSFDVKIRRRKQ